jgi:predicted N-formylglutamate amidohydrolase
MDLENAGATSRLLEGEDVPPVLEDNAEGSSPFLLTCDHYGRTIPRILGDLGLPASEFTRHIAWDRAALLAAGDRLQSPARGGEFNPAHQRSDCHTR